MANVSAMLPGVTAPTTTTRKPSLPEVLGTDAALVELFTTDSPLTGADMTGPTWHLATCHRCGPDFAEPFVSREDRDGWAVSHVDQRGHTVVLAEDPNPGLRPAMILQHVGGTWMWICAGCAALASNHSWSGHRTIAEFRQHTCGQR